MVNSSTSDFDGVYIFRVHNATSDDPKAPHEELTVPLNLRQRSEIIMRSSSHPARATLQEKKASKSRDQDLTRLGCGWI